MKLKKLIGIVLAGAMLTLSLTGCLGHLFTKAMTVDGTDVSAGTYLMMQTIAYSEASEKVDDPESTEDIFKQTIEGEKVEDWIKNRTVELCREYVAVEKLCAEKGVTLSEDSQSYIDQIMDNASSWESFYASNGIGKETIQEYLENTYLKQDLFDVLYEEGGEMAPSRAEIEAYVMETQARIKGFTFSLVSEHDGTTVLGDDSPAKAAIDALVAELQAGTKTIEDASNTDFVSISELIHSELDALSEYEHEEEETEGEQTEEGSGEEVPAEETPIEAEEEAAEEETEEEQESYPNLNDAAIQYEGESNYPEEFLTRLKSEAVGTIGTYVDETNNTITVYQVVAPFADEEEYEGQRASILYEMKEEEFTDYIKGVGDTYTVEMVPGASWYLSPKKIVSE